MEKLKQQFIEQYDFNHIALDLIEMVEDDLLLDYIIKTFERDFTEQELKELEIYL